ncbi:MAG: TetM/TetW/TetO/TetS family tetracycline resistance ribosomal protection protein [Nocardioidaceae bacterium]|nr:TetM/TetW/TetO/TetS family tetracycline resistance ribosomal protection protein [Nocardioidaceae bacterium]NUS52552.1 TetM/TetW/TetO/TetS family tetracycline resistance ribosomal protection protein [Nocardioidaceae bacterium]
MHTLNLGILAHVDAGKTSLTERLLHAAGVIDEIGRVDDGSTQTDTLALERRRGITIKAAVVSFAIGDVTVNLIDTPGHPDFIAEVERVLGVLDGAVLVVSAVEGVQPQTRVLMRTLRRLGIPALVFVNKIDRRGAREEEVVDALRERLDAPMVPMGTTKALGTSDAIFTAYDADDPAFTSSLVDALADGDESFLRAYVDGSATRRLADELRRQARRGLVHPVFLGSAMTGAGVPELSGGIRDLLPAAEGDTEGDLSATVFKVERGAAGEKVAYARLFAGTLHTRDRLGDEGKVTGIDVFADGGTVRRDRVRAGEIARLHGLPGVRVGDRLGTGGGDAEHYFPPPSLETVVEPVRDRDRGDLHVALTQLAEQDPLIDLRRDELRNEVSVSLYGEVQKEVVAATLEEEYGVAVTFRETTTICIERPVGVGAAVELIDVAPNPFLATVGLRVEPGPVGSGVRYRLEVELGSMPIAFMRAVEETVRETLGQGLRGWEVTDCTVTLTHSGYWPRQSHAHQKFDKAMSSTAGDFRHLTPLVLMDALRQAGTQVHEPVHRFRLEVPEAAYGVLRSTLPQLRAVPLTAVPRGSTYVVEGDVPADRVHALEQALPTLTSGEGVLETVFDHYQAVPGPPPERSRTDADPLHRKEYLLRVQRQVQRV